MRASTLEPVDFAEVSTPDWAMERKWDGRREIVTTGPDGPTAYNREGIAHPLPENLVVPFSQIETVATFDGEYANGRLHLFDVPLYGDQIVTPATPWYRRNMALRKFLDLWSPPSADVELVTFVRDPAEKIALLAELQEIGGEGVVFKRLSSLYEHPRRPDDKSKAWRKMKFLSEVDAIVIDVGHEGKNNLTLGLVDPTGPQVLPGGVRGREVGRCSALTGDGKTQTIEIGDVVTVTVTGLGASGRLVEPVSPRLRPGADKQAVDCTIDQLYELRRISR